MSFVNNLRTSRKLTYGFGIIIVLMLVIAFLGYRGISSVHNDLNTMVNEQFVFVEEMGVINADVRQIRGNLYKYAALPGEAGAVLSDFNNSVNEIDEVIEFLKGKNLSVDMLTIFEEFVTNWEEYKAASIEVMSFMAYKDTDSANASLSSGGRMYNALEKMNENLTRMLENNRNQVDQGYQTADESFQQTRLILLLGIAAATLIAVLIINIINQSITRPLALVMQALKTLMVGSTIFIVDEKSRNDLIHRQDEFGELSKSVINTRKYMSEMAGVAEAIANNDLSISVQPKSEDDRLGNMLLTMVRNLNRTISDVAMASTQVKETSRILAGASTQSSQATEQIATTIQQVARGTTQQSEAVNKTASSVEQMGRAIDGVA
ncbi:MAG: methyl-accepting chemotaxis protein, partial [Leptolinea sp.]|nr:methyl-accepting chemotaxis protein [Leptolinea sp.]